MAKTPTLAQLRKLAKRKGQTITGEDGVVKLVEQGTWWLKLVYGPLNILTGGTVVRDERDAKRVLAAALRALPDKGEAPVAKPRTKLPKVWVVMTDSASNGDGRYFYGREGARRARKTWESVRQYAPVQPSRKCVWVQGQYLGIAGCTRGGLSPEYGDAESYTYCPNCGGRITRRSPR